MRPTITLCLLLLTAIPLWGREIQFVEDFVLSKDRSEALQELVPGTDVYYYFQCIHLQNLQKFDEVEQLLQLWQQRHGESASLREIRHRQMLHTYATHPQRTLDYLIKQLGPNLQHQRDRLRDKPALPAELASKRIHVDTLTEAALRRHKGLNGFEDEALRTLSADQLNDLRRRELLTRLTRPDHPELIELILADLEAKGSRGFGSLNVHRALLLKQLDALRAARPKLGNDPAFVNAYLPKLQPHADVDWRNNLEETAAYLARLSEFVGKLSAAHNSLKAHVAYHRLLFDASQGVYDKGRFLAYLALPRRSHYIAPRLLESAAAQRYPVDFSLNPGNVTQLPPIGNDEALVRRYLLHFFRTANQFGEYERFVKADYLRDLFAEAKITGGLGDPERWYSMLAPSKYQSLKERVDLDFAATNRRLFSAGDPVELDLYVKNVEKLIVKVYEINTANYYRQQGREINTDIELDGLVANHEFTYNYSDAPEIRRRRHFEFPQLNRPGVYVIDVIGNGKSSRAVIRKGRLHHIVKTTAAGHEFTVFDDQLKQVSSATLWMSGQHFVASDDGKIRVPFSTKPGRQPIVLSHDGLSTLQFFQHQGEAYSLKVATHIDRESLLPRRRAAILLRPELKLAGIPVSSSVLENVQVTIRSQDLDGLDSEHNFKDVQFVDDQDTPLVFLVPNRLAQLHVHVSATVQTAHQKTKTLTATHELAINQIDATDKIEDVHLTRVGDVYVLEVLGKTGEAKAHRPVALQLKHRQFRDAVRVQLATDEHGLIRLGELDEIVHVKAKAPGAPEKDWSLYGDRRTHTFTVHATQGEALQLPHMLGAAADDVPISLYEMRGNTFAHDLSDQVEIDAQYVAIPGLPAGDYSLAVGGQQRRLRVIDGDVEGDYILGRFRRAEKRLLNPLQIETVGRDADHLTIRLANSSAFSRVHVFATRFVPRFDVFTSLRAVGEIEPLIMRVPDARSYYMAGRKLGDELQYVFERAYGTKYPGNMLERPTLLLNTWPMRSTQTAVQKAERGDRFGAADAAPDAAAAARQQARQAKQQALTDFANLDFLAAPGAVLVNREPNGQGVVKIPLADLSEHQHIHVVAIDPLSTVYRSMALPEVKLTKRDLRLRQGLDPTKHYTQQKLVRQLAAGDVFELADITTGRFETYDHLQSVYELYATLSGSEVLEKFRFVLDWPQLSTAEKQAKYSEFACHELNFFLARKDPQFFADVVAPYIENKHHKTFLDLYLLGEDLEAFLEPWQYAQLNTVERILLGDRLQGEAERVRQLIEDLFSLVPRNIDQDLVWFETAIRGKDLDHTVTATLADQQNQAIAAMAAPMAGGGLGGRPASNRALGLQSRFSADGAELMMDAEVAEGEDVSRRRRAKLSSEALRLGRGLVEDAKAYAGKAAADRKNFYAATRQLQRLYERLEKTREWAENNYYQLPIEQQNGDLVGVNAFWQDFARRNKQTPFFSIHWTSASRNFTEMMFALSVLDLPFVAGEHDTVYEDRRMRLTAGGPVVLFQEQIRETQRTTGESPVLVTQNYFRADDRYEMVQGVRRDKFVTDEFLAQVVYGCQVVVTNPTSSPRKVDILLQIPHAAMAIQGGKPTKTVVFDLPPFHTKTVDYFFYFPAAGEFSHFPAHVSQDESLLAFAEPRTLAVVDEPSQVDKESWSYVSQLASQEDVLEYLRSHNVFELNLDRIAHRMHDANFFEQVIELLGARHAFSPTLWAYALKHNDRDVLSTYLKHQANFLAQCGATLDCELLQIDPVARKSYQHLDYKPLVNARAHQLGDGRQILNDRLHQQYHALLEVLKYRPELTSEDRLALTYYLLLQDRIEEALDTFARVERSRVASHLQYDYFAAYLDLFQDQPQRARGIADAYADYPVPKWRTAFASITAMLDEVDGKEVTILDPKDRTQNQTAAADAQASFTLHVENRQVRIDYAHLNDVQVNYYLIDLELLFSSNPFVQTFGGQFSHIQPHESHVVRLPGNGNQHSFPLPKALHNRNVLVEVVGAGITRSQAYYSNSLNVQIAENYGQLKVTDRESGRPVAKTYVKVYAERKDGNVTFFKDGYTDLRGRFDYSSLSTNELDFVKRFSILVLDEDRGGLVREASVPKR